MSIECPLDIICESAWKDYTPKGVGGETMDADCPMRQALTKREFTINTIYFIKAKIYESRK